MSLSRLAQAVMRLYCVQNTTDLNPSISYCFVEQQCNSGLGHLIVEVSRSRIIRHTHTPSRTPPNERLVVAEAASPPPPHTHTNTQQTQETNMHTVNRIRTREPSYRAGSNLRFRLHGHRVRLPTSTPL